MITEQRLGDILLTTPLIRSLRRAWPDARLDVMVLAGNEGILAANPDIDRVLPFPRGFGARAAFCARLVRRYDLAVSTLPGDRPTTLAWLAAPVRIGPLDPRKPWRRHLLTAVREIDLRGTHSVLRHLELADLLGVARAYDLVMGWTAQEHASLRPLLPEGGRTPYVVLHPSPMYPYKAWTQQGWIALARWLSGRGLAVVLTGAGGEAERALAAAITAAVPGTVDTAGRLGLGAVAALIADARLFVGPDTVVTHIAAAVGTHTIALFGPSNPLQFAPWPRGWHEPRGPFALRGSATVNNVTLLQGEGDCVPCLEEGCERHQQSRADCLREMPAARVIAAAQRVLEGPPGKESDG